MKKIISVAVTTLLMLSLVTGCGKQAVPQETEESRPIEITEAGLGSISTEYIYSGTAMAGKTANVFCAVQGKVKKVYVDIGDTVKAGETLFSMDSNTLENSLAAAQAQVDLAQIGVESANGAQTQMNLKQVEVGYNAAKRAYESTKALYEEGYVSKNEMEQVKDTYEQAKQSYELTSTEVLELSKKQAQAQLTAAQAQVKTLQDSLEDAVVESPISGVITGNNVTEGVLLSSQVIPMTVSDLSSVEVQVSVSEEVVVSLHSGDPANVVIPTLGNDLFPAVIKTVNPAADRQGTYGVELTIPNDDGAIKGGMFAQVHFQNQQAEDVIVVNRDVVLEKSGEHFVFIEKDGIARKVPVTIGIDNGEQVQITDGVSEGDRLISTGQAFLSDGELVRVIDPDAEPEKPEDSQESATTSADSSAEPATSAEEG